MNQTKAKGVVTHNYNRACDACRLHKVRCLPNPSPSSKICQRCAKTDRECVFHAPQKRKQRKRTDTRVAELEREVQAMRALFDGGQRESANGGMSGIQISNTADGNLGIPTATGEDGTNLLAGGGNAELLSGDALRTGDSASTSTSARSPFSPDQDVVDRGVITASQAEELYQIYNTHLVQHYPAVFFPADYTVEDLRRTKPTLFLAVIAAAAAKIDPHLYSILNSEVLHAYAYRTVISSEKSLELVQAMTVTCVWYFPPGKYSKLKFYEYIHMAVTMALDLGLGQNPKTSRCLRAGVSSPEDLSDEDIEKRRVFLVCYVINIGSAFSMRRPNSLRYNSWMEECLNSIATNEKPHAQDQSLIKWVKIMKITEELHVALSFDDIGNIANLSETRVQLMVNGFEKQLDAWKGDAGAGTPIALLITYHFTQVQLHELALHDDHPPEDFRAPFRMDKLLSIQVIPEARSSHIDATSILISNAHALFEILLHMTVEELRELPIYNFVRMAVCVIVLLKLHISSKTPQSKIGAVLETQDIKLGFYLSSLLRKLHDAADFAEFRAPLTFLNLITWLARWYKDQEDDAVFTLPDPLQYPLDICWLPPVSAVSMTQFQGGINQDLQHPSSKLANLTEADMNGWNPAAESHLDTLATELFEDYTPYDPMEFMDSAFDDWARDPNEASMLPDMDDRTQLHTDDWGFPIPVDNGDTI